MKKFFEEPTIECIRLQTESVASSTGGIGGNTGTGYAPSGDLPPEG